jgi:hypothetical protein
VKEKKMAKKHWFWGISVLTLVFGLTLASCEQDDPALPSDFVRIYGKITARNRDDTVRGGNVLVVLAGQYNGSGMGIDQKKTSVTLNGETGTASWEIIVSRSWAMEYDRFGITFEGDINCGDVGSFTISDNTEEYNWGNKLFSPVSGKIERGDKPAWSLYILEESVDTLDGVWKDFEKRVSTCSFNDDEGTFNGDIQIPDSRQHPTQVYFLVIQWEEESGNTKAWISKDPITIEGDGSTPDQDITSDSWKEIPRGDW